jgi:hypothetical protein
MAASKILKNDIYRISLAELTKKNEKKNLLKIQKILKNSLEVNNVTYTVAACLF